MDGKGRWVDNVFIERLWRSVKYEEVYLHAYRDGREAREHLAAYFDTYNRSRLHQSLDYCTPKEEIQRLKIRVVLLQSLAVQTALWGPSLAPPATLLANKRRLVAHIDEQGLLLEQQILRSRTAHTDAERAATADEVHAAVEELKSFFDVLQLPGPGPSGSA